MLNQKDKQVLMLDVEENMSKLYWSYRDSIDDDGARELEKLVDKTTDQIINIVEKFPA